MTESRLRWLWLTVLGLVVFASGASAEPITFTHQGSGSGTIDGVAFVDKRFTITALGDTESVQDGTIANYKIWYVNHLAATIDIAEVGTFRFVSPTRTFVNQPASVVGFSRPDTWGLDLFDGPTSIDFATWDMKTSIGPISETVPTASLMQWDNQAVETDGGTLFFTPNPCTGRFVAVIQPLPSLVTDFISSMISDQQSVSPSFACGESVAGVVIDDPPSCD